MNTSEKQKRVCAIHDISCTGRCSLTVALPIISAAGFDCAVVPTAVLSTHTGGFTNFTYTDLTKDIEPISKHWQSLELNFDAIYSGFLGSFKQIDLVGNFFNNFKTKDNIILVDPVMADNGKLYSIYSYDMVMGMTKLCSKADIIIPNITEACFMVGSIYKKGPYDKPYIEDLLQRLSKLGAKKIVLTGVHFDNESLGTATFDTQTGEIEYIFSQYIDGHFHGTGDVFGSAFLSALLSGKSLSEASLVASNYVVECIQHTIELSQEARYGVCFERALPFLLKKLDLV